VFHLRRFHWKRKRAALVLLPATAMLFVSGLAAAQTVPTPATPQDEAVASGGRAESVVRVRARRHVMAGETVRIVGRATPGAGRWVTVRIAGKKARTVRTRKKGGFRVRWQAPHAGIYRVTAIVRGTERARRARSRSRTINAYRSAEASYYGPGLYGHGTACGRTLTASTVGVANKTLPCGTRVRFRYRGRSVVAPVIDRGPYAGNREWDLTAALKAKLGFGAVGRVLSTR
jgi:peptidoglycan lytic transglycosylase